jgi:ABC-2 type transport system permease protein
MKFKRIIPIVKKEFRQVRRDTRTLAILIFMPVFLLVMFGYALNFDVKHISLAVYDEDRSKTSRDFIQEFFQSEYFDQKYYLQDQQRINELLDENQVTGVLVVPYDFSRKVLSGQNAEIQILVDGSNSNAAATVIGYANGIVQAHTAKILIDLLLVKTGRKFSMPIDYQPRVWYNPELKSAQFLIPGLIAFILMLSGVVSTALSVVREKERGTMEQIIVSPIKPLELILGKAIAYIVISIASAYLILLMGWLIFDVPVKGSQVELFLVTLLFLFVALGMGLFISTISDSQQVAFQISALLTILPTFLLSGFVFPIRNMPKAIQLFTYIIPARYFLIALRAIMLKGVGIAAFWQQVLFMAAFAVIVTSLSWVRMRKKRL